MPLTPGTRLGPYEVLAPLGAGGMGEVYRARDTRLERDVAIKILPDAFAADADRRTRFEREAKTIAALSHPNVVSIHDTGLHNGQLYLVMELLAGQSLRDALAGAALPVRKAIDIAVQMARGLAAAHEQGLVHRDLKPENVFLLPDGRVKILDFGLARATTRGSGATETGTALTDPGSVLGTVGYMAPEQVRGQVTDARADLFALGAVLYEMLTGRRAFQRDTAADTLSAILKEDPPGLATTNTAVSPALDRIVPHCLEKNPAERFQTARDVAFALEALSGSGAEPPANATATSVMPSTTTRERQWHALAGLSLIAAVVAVIYAVWSPGRPGVESGGGEASSGRFSINLAEPAAPVVLGAGGQWPAPAVALSPDGRTLVYVGRSGTMNQLFARTLSDVDVRPLSGTQGAWGPFFSPDGEWVGFFSGDRLGKVKVEVAGEPIFLGSFNTPTSAVWLRDGRIVVAESEGYEFTVMSDQGGNRETFQKSLEGGVLSAALDDEWLLAGRRLISKHETRWLVTDGIVDDPMSWLSERSIFVSATQYLSGEPGALVWVDAGRLSGVAFDMPFGGKARRFARAVRVLPDKVNEPFPGVADLAVARSGVAVYASPTVVNAPLKTADPSGEHDTLAVREASYLQPAWSPDGRRIAVNVHTKPGVEVRLLDLLGKNELLVKSTSYLGSPRWRPPDGRSLLYTENPWTPAATVFEIEAAPGAEPRQVSVRGDGTLVGVTPAGGLVVQPVDLNRGLEVWLLDGSRRVLTNQPHSAFVEYSADGKWVTWASIVSGQWDVYVAHAEPGASPSPRRVTDFGCGEPRWGAGSRTIVCQGLDDLFEIPISMQAAEVQPGKPRPLALGKIMSSTSGDYSFDVNAEGRIVFVPETGPSTTRELHVITNLLKALRGQGR